MTVPSRMVREGRWKYIHYHGGKLGAELYDLDSDRRELRNRVADPSCAPVRDRLHALLFADGWDPERVLLRCQREVEEAEAMKRWCETTRPKEPCFFMDRLRPDVNQAQ